MIDPPRGWYQRLFVGLQFLLPHHLLSALVGRLTRVRWRPLKDLLIRLAVRRLPIDMSEARERDPAAYESFNAFFTRPLRPEVRPIAAEEDALACPVDGVLSQLGDIGEGRIVQAKGRDYSLLDLLAGRRDLEREFADGAFATIYLSPRDYHRIHMPLEGVLRDMIHTPGRLFSVNPVTAALVPRLFARNERLICLFDTPAGAMALIPVGAIFVGSIETVWAGRVTPARSGAAGRVGPEQGSIHLDKGVEMGRFNMGSTLIMLFPAGATRWDPRLTPGARMRMGERMGALRPTANGRRLDAQLPALTRRKGY